MTGRVSRRASEGHALAERALAHSRGRRRCRAGLTASQGGGAGSSTRRPPRAEAAALAEEAVDTAAAVRELPRVSDSGRIAAGWDAARPRRLGRPCGCGARRRRGGLVAERERLLREAGELAAAALGEPLYGVGVAAVRRRLEAPRSPPGWTQRRGQRRFLSVLETLRVAAVLHAGGKPVRTPCARPPLTVVAARRRSCVHVPTTPMRSNQSFCFATARVPAERHRQG